MKLKTACIGLRRSFAAMGCRQWVYRQWVYRQWVCISNTCTLASFIDIEMTIIKAHYTLPLHKEAP